MISIKKIFSCRLSGIFFCFFVLFFSQNLFAQDVRVDHNIKIEKTFFLDGVVLDEAIFLVGEQGVLSRSIDGGQSWEKKQIANKKTLTSIAFNKKNIGILVGHNGALLRTVDGGKSFKNIKNNFLDSHHTFIRVKWINENSVVAIGSFGLFIQSDDQGKTWQKKIILNRDFDWHLYDFISLKNGKLLIGEAGTILYKKNKSQIWKKIISPYKGSLFGAVKHNDRKILLFGMRGKIFELTLKSKIKPSVKNFFQWKEIHTNSKATIMAALHYSSSKTFFFGDSGIIFLLDKDNSVLYSVKKDIKSFAGGIKMKDGSIIGYGLRGLKKIELDEFKKIIKPLND